ncbi:glutaredoxin family protein [uncultured Propionivibrio sp.]|uniref:glutaredoxin family protein n=1 Tax=uncultured Propionivibrio sp. TaxID=426737 RepID=UPI0029C0C30A|nr:glutaredoxin family protein [uncultured Propionivibrio sp.]
MAFCLTLISRSYCHLCHEMELAAAPLVAEFGGELKLLDVDADPELLALYDERVPVLLHEDEILSQYFLDHGKVRDYLSKIS